MPNTKFGKEGRLKIDSIYICPGIRNGPPVNLENPIGRGLQAFSEVYFWGLEAKKSLFLFKD